MYHLFYNIRKANTTDELMAIITEAVELWREGLFCSDERDLIILYVIDKFNQIKETK